ncbi:MAG: hypothetical protein HFI93_03010 [Lachnospiraceae bacterium]|nr:hypothetical protein [Lachnospiraceae bacterium]
MRKRVVVYVIALLLTVGSVASATTQDFGFWFRKVNEKNQSAAAKKDDSEARAYVTGQNIVMDPTSGSVYVGFRVRSSAGTAATDYKVFSVQGGGAPSVGGRNTLNYYSGMANAGSWYTLNGQYDDASTDTTNSWSIGGRWTP